MRMARLEIEVEQNEYALFDATLYYNGELYATQENYTTEAAAVNAAVQAGKEKGAVRG